MEKKFLPRIYTSNNDLSARWFVWYVDNDGKRKRKYGDINHFDTIKERQAAALKVVSELQSLKFKTSYQEISAKIYEGLDRMKATWRPKTYSCKKSKLDIFLKWMKHKAWTPKNVHRFFFEYLSKTKNLNPTTYNDYIRCLNQALQWCDAAHLMEKIEKRKASPSPASYFTQSQKNFIVQVLEKENPDLLFFVQFVYYCFLRPRSELRLMRVGDIILEDKKILVPASIAKNKKQQYIAIPDAFFPIVKRKIKNRNPNHYIFPGNNYKSPMGTNTFGRQHRLLLQKLDFDTSRYKLYSWKHTGAVMAVKAGIHIKQLQIQLRHHSLDQVDAYLRQLGVSDLGDLQKLFPRL